MREVLAYLRAADPFLVAWAAFGYVLLALLVFVLGATCARSVLG